MYLLNKKVNFFSLKVLKLEPYGISVSYFIKINYIVSHKLLCLLVHSLIICTYMYILRWYFREPFFMSWSFQKSIDLIMLSVY